MDNLYVLFAGGHVEHILPDLAGHHGEGQPPPPRHQLGRQHSHLLLQGEVCMFLWPNLLEFLPSCQWSINTFSKLYVSKLLLQI